MLKFIKRLLHIYRNFEKMARTINAQATAITDMEAIIRSRTTISADIGARQHQSYVVLVGTLNGRDFVQSFALDGELRDIHRQMRDMERYGRIHRVDAPPSFRGVWERNPFR